MVLNLGGGAVLEILYPDRDVSKVSREAANDRGVVARLIYGSSVALLMADVSEKVEKELIALEVASSSNGLKSDVLKVGHHGSKSSTASDHFSKPL